MTVATYTQEDVLGPDPSTFFTSDFFIRDTQWHINTVATYTQEDVLGPDPSTFFTFDFFMHDTQATPVVASSKPEYNTLVQVGLSDRCRSVQSI